MLTNYLLLLFCLLALFFSIMIISSKNPIHSILYLILVFCNITFVLIILGVEFIAITFLIVYVGAIAVLFLFVVMMLNIKILELDEIFWKYIPVGLLISSCFLVQLFFFVFDFNVLDVLSLFFYDRIYQLMSIEMISKAKALSEFGLDHLYSMGDINSFQDPSLFDISGRDWWSQYSHLVYPFVENIKFVMIPHNVSIFQNCLALSVELTNTELLGWVVYTYTFFIFLVISLILLVSMVGSIILVLNQNVNIKRQLIFRQTLRDLKSSVSLKS